MVCAAKMLLGTVCAVAIGTALTATARAGAFAVGDLSAVGVGDAFAGSAAGTGGVSSAFANPATLTQTPGWQSTTTFAGAAPSMSIRPETGTSPYLLPLGNSGELGKNGFVPSAATSYQFNQTLWFGLLTDAPYGLSAKPAAPWAGSLYGGTSKVTSLAIAPTAALKVNDWLSVGGGVEALYFSTRQSFSYAPPNSAYGGTLFGNAWGVGYNLGATVTPRAGTEIGIGYHSQVQEDVKGMLVAPGILTSPIQTTITLPQSIDVGLRQRLTGALTLNAGYAWTNWSVFNSFPVYVRGTGTQLPAPFGTSSYRYRDGHRFSVGGDYLWNPNLILRAGLGYEISPVTDANRSVRVPDSDRILASVGASYRVSQRFSVDLGYMHGFMLGHHIDIANGNPAYSSAIPLPLVGALSSSLDVVSASLTYRWDTPAETAPLIRKY